MTPSPYQKPPGRNRPTTPMITTTSTAGHNPNSARRRTSCWQWTCCPCSRSCCTSRLEIGEDRLELAVPAERGDEGIAPLPLRLHLAVIDQPHVECGSDALGEAVCQRRCTGRPSGMLHDLDVDHARPAITSGQEGSADRRVHIRDAGYSFGPDPQGAADTVQLTTGNLDAQPFGRMAEQTTCFFQVWLLAPVEGHLDFEISLDVVHDFTLPFRTTNCWAGHGPRSPEVVLRLGLNAWLRCDVVGD